MTRPGIEPQSPGPLWTLYSLDQWPVCKEILKCNDHERTRTSKLLSRFPIPLKAVNILFLVTQFWKAGTYLSRTIPDSNLAVLRYKNMISISIVNFEDISLWYWFKTQFVPLFIYFSKFWKPIILKHLKGIATTKSCDTTKQYVYWWQCIFSPPRGLSTLVENLSSATYAQMQ